MFQCWVRRSNAVLFVFLLVTLQVGCTSGGGKPDVLVTPQIAGSIATFVAREIPPHPLVVITVPLRFTGNNVDEARRYYRLMHQSPTPLPDNQVDAAMAEGFAKTLYYVSEFYSVLASRLPPDSVVLVPTEIMYAPGVLAPGFLPNYRYTAPAMGDVIPPSVVRIDFGATFVSAVRQSNARMSRTDTIGHLVSVQGVIVVQDVLRKSFPSSMVPSPTLRKRVVARDGSVSFFPTGQGGEIHQIRLSTSPKSLRQGMPFGDISAFRVEADAFRVSMSSNVADPLESPFAPLWQYYANATIDALNSFDWQRSASGLIIAYIYTSLDLGEDLARQYVKVLEGKTRWEDVHDGNSRWELIQKFLSIERRFLAEQDRNLVADVYEGDFGRGMRAQFMAESRYLTEVEAAEERERRAAFNALLNTALVGVYAGATAREGNSSEAYQALFNNLSSQLQLYNQAMQNEEAFLQQLKRNLDSHFARTRESATTFRIITAHGEREIRATNLKELRSTFKAIYRELYPKG